MTDDNYNTMLGILESAIIVFKSKKPEDFISLTLNFELKDEGISLNRYGDVQSIIFCNELQKDKLFKEIYDNDQDKEQ